MKIFEIGTGYTSIPAKMGAATEIVVEELTRSMLKQGQDVVIVDIKDKQRQRTDLPIDEVYMPQFFSTGSVVKLGVVHKVKRVLYSISLTRILHKLIKMAPTDEKIFLHFHNQYNLYFFLKLTSRSMRNRCIIGYTVHSYIWFGEWECIKDTIKKRYFQEVYCCQNADKVFVLNEIVSEMLTGHYEVKPERICQVINGVNIDTYSETSANSDELLDVRRKFGLVGKRVIFQVGSVCERKNQLGTLNLLVPVMKKRKDIVFAYVGGIIDQEYANRIIEKAKEENISERVIYYGEVSPGKQLNLLYTIAEVCIMNSKSEAFALVIAEALSVPRPIFISQAIMDSLVFWGKNVGNGILKIDDDFESNLQRLLDDEEFRDMMRCKGRNFIQNEYSWDVAAQNYLRHINGEY